MPKPLKCDRVLCAVILGLTFFGLIMVFSATTGSADGSMRFVIKQSIAVGAGLLAMRVLMFLDYHRLATQRAVFIFSGGVVTLLCGVLFLGQTANTNRFLKLWAFSIQPSEFAKLAVVLFLAHYLVRRRKQLHDWRTLGAVWLLVALLCGLIVFGRDLGTAVLVMVIAAVVLFVAGLKHRYFVIAMAAAVVLVTLAVWAEPYRMERVMTFLNPESDPLGAGYQINQSQIAVSTGGWVGQGLMAGKQKMDFLPAAHNDFIFAVICEELGFAGGVAVIMAFLVILWRGIIVSVRAPDLMGRYLAAGITAMVVCQAMINLGVVLALLPTKGLPLPFISYGGTAVATALASSGILLNVSQQTE